MSISPDNSTDYMKVRTKGNSPVRGKPRVYFTCHPQDFELYFDTVCEAIFKTHDCAIYYTADMTAPIPTVYRDADLGSMNLFVMPVTFRLLREQNRAMLEDFPYAAESDIPILPLMMETGIEAFYEHKFGKRQFLSPYSEDRTEISFEQKLHKYLESILISDEMAKRVRAAFDAYIFLSYRKKDRVHANELIRLIHQHPECRDIAIWYDEFLTPGASFLEEIQAALDKSQLFALLVTPNLLEEPDGKPNFVMGEEYPAAVQAKKIILPAEMETTDRTVLAEKFPSIPECTDPHQPSFRDRLLRDIQRIVNTANDTDPDHNFLMGLAYLDGIDVEIDRQRGMDLITVAAESGLPEAIWRLGTLAGTYRARGDFKKALELNEKAYQLYCRFLGEEHPDTLTSLSNLSLIYNDLGNHQKAVELQEKVYQLRCRILGEEHPDTLMAMNNLSVVYGESGENQKALEMGENAYKLQCRIWGENHPDTLASLSNLATIHNDHGNHKKALELIDKVYKRQCDIWGEEHPRTLTSLNNLVTTHLELKNYQKALDLGKKVYHLRCRILGEEHPNTLNSLNNMAVAYARLRYDQKALELFKKLIQLQSRFLGEEHPNTLVSLNNTASVYYELNDYRKALKVLEQVYQKQCRILGEEHPNTLDCLHNVAMTYGRMGDYRKALELMEKLYRSQCRTLGTKHIKTWDTFRTLNLLRNFLNN